MSVVRITDVPSVTTDVAFSVNSSGPYDQDPIEGEEHYNAFDNDLDTKWIIFNNNCGNVTSLSPDQVWVKIIMPENQYFRLHYYVIYSANDVPDRDPKNWLIQGSNDDSEWTTLDMQINQQFDDRFALSAYEILNDDRYEPESWPTTLAYRYIRFSVLQKRGAVGSGSNAIQLSELKIYGEVASQAETGGDPYIIPVRGPPLKIPQSYEKFLLFYNPPSAIYATTDFLPLDEIIANPHLTKCQKSLQLVNTYYVELTFFPGNLKLNMTQIPQILPPSTDWWTFSKINENQINITSLASSLNFIITINPKKVSLNSIILLNALAQTRGQSFRGALYEWPPISTDEFPLICQSSRRIPPLLKI